MKFPCAEAYRAAAATLPLRDKQAYRCGMISIPMNQQRYEAKIAEAKADGCEVSESTPTSGTVAKLGFIFEFSYENGNLSGTFLEHPGIFTTAYCERKLAAWMA